MPNKVYDSDTIKLIDGTEIFITPLKIKYLREFMQSFENLEKSQTEDDGLNILIDCIRIAMKQYYPELKTVSDVEDNLDLKTMYKILEIAAGIKINESSQDTVKQQAQDSSPKWSEIDLVALESEAFLLGIWKDYDELELSLSMPELTTTLNAKREADYREKRFLAAMQGVDLDKQTGRADENAWEKLKAKVFSKGKTDNPNDIIALQGSSIKNSKLE